MHRPLSNNIGKGQRLVVLLKSLQSRAVKKQYHDRMLRGGIRVDERWTEALGALGIQGKEEMIGEIGSAVTMERMVDTKETNQNKRGGWIV